MPVLAADPEISRRLDSRFVRMKVLRADMDMHLVTREGFDISHHKPHALKIREGVCGIVRRR
jgi:hypothetical protein